MPISTNAPIMVDIRNFAVIEALFSMRMAGLVSRDKESMDFDGGGADHCAYAPTLTK